MTKSQATDHGHPAMSKSYRLREEETEKLKTKRIQMVITTKADIRESDLLHALIWKFLDQLSEKDVIKYREEVLGKEE